MIRTCMFIRLNAVVLPVIKSLPCKILLDFSLTVKAATLIPWCGLAISSAKEMKSGFIYNLVKSK